MKTRPITVGLDGSSGSAAAARWALAEGARWGCPVVAVVAWDLLEQAHPAQEADFEPHYDEDDASDALLSWLVDAVGTDDAERFERRPVLDLPARALLAAGDKSSMLVVGARGAGGFVGLRLGSVADGVVRHPHVPTVVVTGSGNDAGRVVVGVDGSAGSQAALEWAAAEAHVRGVALEILHAWHPSPLLSWAMLPNASMFENVRAESEAVARLAAQSASGTVADVVTTCIDGSPAQRLFEASEEASVVVVGCRGLGRVAGTALGSVSRQVVHHSSCPVAVIPTPE